jgi:hypothetical protein
MKVDTLEIKTSDPLGLRMDLSLSGTYYPFGFPATVVTNSEEALRASAESWSRYSKAFDRAPVEIRVAVMPGDELAPEPAFRAQRHIVTFISNSANFAICDCKARFGFCFTNSKTVADRAWFRWHFLEAMTYTLLGQRDTVAMHAACVAKNGRGMLLCGLSGAGKSTLAYACALSGWTYVGDDATMLLPEGEPRMALGKPHEIRFRDDAAVLFPELQEYAARVRPNGKLTIEVPISALSGIRTASQCRIDCVVFLSRAPGSKPQARRISGAEAMERLLLDMPAYEDDTWSLHQQTVRALTNTPAYEFRYEALPAAVDFLSTLLDKAAAA